MWLKKIDFREIYGIKSNDLLLTWENVLEWMTLTITSYFCMGTELRFLKLAKEEGFETTKDDELWHGKSLQLAAQFLPGDAPLVRHIVSSYQKHHAPVQQAIPEDAEVVEDVIAIKPYNGVQYSKSSPVIRPPGKPTVTMMPLDLPANQYNTSKLTLT